MQQPLPHGLYGTPPADLSDAPDDVVQFSPLMPGSSSLADENGTLAGMTMLAPPGTIERRAVLACSLRALAPGARLTALAPKDKGGSRIARELENFGCAVMEAARRHHRIVTVARPDWNDALGEAIAAGAPRFDQDLGLWTQPGIFSWDRLDPGSLQLMEHMTGFSGRGADLGCGLGLLAHGILRSPTVESLALIDIDRRAIEAARRNVDDPRVTLHWGDARKAALENLDFVVTNPPFHDGGIEDKALGKGFIAKAASSLRRGGTLWMVANRHLPYEGVLEPLFKRVTLHGEAEGYKIYEAVK